MTSDTLVMTDYTNLGLTVVALAGLSALALAFYGRTRLHPAVVIAALVLCGAGIGLGAAWIEDAGRAPAGLGAQRLLAVVLLAVLTPLHARVVLGPLGKRA